MTDTEALPSPALPASPGSHTPLPTVCDTLLGCSAPERVEESLIPVCCCWFAVTLLHPCMYYASITHPSVHHAPIRPSHTHPSIIHATIYPWTHPSTMHPSIHHAPIRPSSPIHHMPIRPSCTHPSIICPSIYHVPIYTGTHPCIMHPSINVHIHPSCTNPSMHTSIHQCTHPSNFPFLQPLSIHVLSTIMSVGFDVFENIHS